jgi:lipopolysaccharide export system protein LptC
MAVELHLPDLPEVEVTLGPVPGAPTRPSLPWHLRLREALASYLPLLLMALLALGTWWLVKNTPGPPRVHEAAPPRSEPDYTMSAFVLQRFDPDGRLAVRIEGRALRHFPDTDRVEIDAPTLRAIAPDGRETLASAARALANGDASEVQLLGGAAVDTVDHHGLPLTLRGEFLHFFVVTERLRTHLPVLLTHGSDRLSAGGLELDLPARRIDLQAPVRAVFAAPARP